jgi:hypothetical protein
MPFKDEAKKIETELRMIGFMPSDIVKVAYHLLESNIDGAESLKESEKRIADLMARAEELLKED